MLRARSLVLCLLAISAVSYPALADGEERTRPVEACSWDEFRYDRPVTQSGSTVRRDVLIPLPDGTTMAADVHLPGAGTGRYPVALTITGYGKNAQAWSDASLIAHGYAHVVVDDVGTGASEGQWDAWGPATQRAYGDVVDWIVEQEWAHPSVGMVGASYMGLTQLLTAAQQPEGLKAVFANVPSGDAYRDIVFQGGQFNAAFIPAWMGLVAATSAAPSSAIFTDPEVGAQATVDHATNLATFKAAVTASGATGGEAAYDGDFWRDRSPIEHVDDIEVPVFLIGGQDDLFQRSTPMLYEALSDREAETKLIEGPWDHLGGSMASGLAAAGLPSLDQLHLQWFDEHVGAGYLDAPEVATARAVCTPDLTQFIRGTDPAAERYEVQADGAWPRPDLVATTLRLSADGRLLDAEPASAGAFRMAQQQPSGVCSR